MEKIGRNEPCPCGSGKKYKKCCLSREQEAVARKRAEAGVAGGALEWLVAAHPEGVREAVQEDFYRGIKTSEKEMLNTVTHRYSELLNVNLGEWLLTDAMIRSGEERKPVRELLLGDEGPNLGPRGGEWLDNLGEFPLSLYEVRRVEHGVGMLLADLLLPDEPEVWVSEKVASTGLFRWDTVAARLVRRDDERILSGALYPFEREAALGCLAKIARKVKKEERGSGSSRPIIGDIIRKDWLKSVVGSLPSEDSEAPAPVESRHPDIKDFDQWAEDRLAVLDGKTPREAVKSAAGRRAVTEILKGWELKEARRAREQGVEPFGFGFLWEGLGLRICA